MHIIGGLLIGFGLTGLLSTGVPSPSICITMIVVGILFMITGIKSEYKKRIK